MSKKRKRSWDGFVCKQGSVLDVGIWGNLPLDLQLKLLAHLPLPALVRFQLVSKAWFKAIRNIRHVRDCYVARPDNEQCSLRVYSSLHEGFLKLGYPGWSTCLACTGHGLLCFHDGYSALLYHPFTRKVTTVPDPPVREWAIFFGVQWGNEAGDFTIVRVVLSGPDRTLLLVYASRRGTWEATPLQLPAQEEFSRAVVEIHSFQGVIHGSALYFLTMNSRAPEMSLRSVDVLDNVTGISRHLFSWSSLPPCLPEPSYPYTRRFTGSIAIVAGDIYMGCMRLVSKRYTVALRVYDKQGKRWEFVSEMPLAKGFVRWRPQEDQYVDLVTQGHTLIVRNYNAVSACLYNTQTKARSLLGRKAGTEVCGLSLSMS